MNRLPNGLLPYLSICAAVLAIYLQTGSFELTHCDDYKNLVEERELIGGLSQVPEAFRRPFGNFYRPLLRVSYMVDAEAGHMEPAFFHGTNVLLHLAASCLLFSVLSSLKIARGAAWGAASIFAVHPVLAGAVAWIPGRNDSLLAVFLLLALRGLIRYRDRGGAPAWAGHMLAFGAALFSKETALLFPLAGIVFLKVRSGGSPFLKKASALAAGWGGWMLLWFFMRQQALERVSSPDLLGWEAFTSNWPALFALSGKILLPARLSGLATFDGLSIVSGAVLLAGLFALAARFKGPGRPMVWFGIFWFLLFLAPPLFSRLAGADDHFDYMEHRAYLPLFGLCLALALLLKPFFERLGPKGAACAILVLSAALGVRSFSYVQVFREPFVFWEHAVRLDPNRSNFHSVLGKLHFESGDLDAAEAAFQRAIGLSKLHDPDNYRNLAVIRRKKGDLECAAALYREAIELSPGRADYFLLLGQVLYEMGAFEEGKDRLLEALRLDPLALQARIVLCGIHAAEGRIDLAIQECLEVLEVDSVHFHALNILGSLYESRGEGELAAKMWERILQEDPTHQPSRRKLEAYWRSREPGPKAER